MPRSGEQRLAADTRGQGPRASESEARIRAAIRRLAPTGPRARTPSRWRGEPGTIPEWDQVFSVASGLRAEDPL